MLIAIPSAVAASPPEFTTATWVWQTRPLLETRTEVTELIEHCQRFAIGRVFLQLPTTGRKLRDASDLRPFAAVITQLHEAGIRVEALDGDPHFALRSEHERVLATTRAVLEYNETATPAARFDGFRLDVEPYLLPQFSSKERDDLLLGYLELLTRVGTIIGSIELDFGVDIPFWYDTLPSLDRASVTDSFLHDVLRRVGNASVMAYRTELTGDDGVFAHIQNELDVARLLGRKLYVALESAPEADKVSFHQKGFPALSSALEALERRLSSTPVIAGLAVHSYESMRALVGSQS